jgi:hypothetical protein
MGAARFAAAIAARERADPEYRQRAAAQRELGREIWKLETKYRERIEDLRRDLAAAQTALRDAQATNYRLARQLQAADDRFREEIGIAHAVLAKARTENANMQERLRKVAALDRLLAAVTQADSDR